jgi:hypothetical protein
MHSMHVPAQPGGLRVSRGARGEDRTRELRRRARARQKSWRWPCEKLPPLSVTGASRRLSRPSMTGFSATASRACHTSTSECSPKGSRLRRTDPENMNGSCGIMLRPRRSVSSPMPQMSTPSMNIAPASGSTMRKNARNSELLPLPVRPTMPTCSRAATLNEILRRTSGNPGRYRITSLTTSTLPALGHSLPSGSFGVVRAASSASCTSPACMRRARYCSAWCACTLRYRAMRSMQVHDGAHA